MIERERESQLGNFYRVNGSFTSSVRHDSRGQKGTAAALKGRARPGCRTAQAVKVRLMYIDERQWRESKVGKNRQTKRMKRCARSIGSNLDSRLSCVCLMFRHNWCNAKYVILFVYLPTFLTFFFTPPSFVSVTHEAAVTPDKEKIRFQSPYDRNPFESNVYLLRRASARPRKVGEKPCRFVNGYIIWTGDIVSVPARWLLRSLGAHMKCDELNTWNDNINTNV